MNLELYVENLNRQLAVAAEAGGDEARALAERLVAPLQAAIRLTLQDALAAAVEEITTELAPGSVQLRLRGRDPEFVVTPPPAECPTTSRPGSSRQPRAKGCRSTPGSCERPPPPWNEPARPVDPNDAPLRARSATRAGRASQLTRGIADAYLRYSRTDLRHRRVGRR